MYYKKYEGERVYLSPMSLDDYKTYTAWVNDETLARGIGNFKMLITEENEKEWISSQDKNGIFSFAVIDKKTNKLLGNYGLEVRDQVSRRFHVGGFIGEKENRGKGYGTEALMLVTKFAFEILNANTLFSGIYSFNEASLKSAKKAGYKEAGRFRNSYYYNSKFYDEIMIEMTREDYDELKKGEIVEV